MKIDYIKKAQEIEEMYDSQVNTSEARRLIAWGHLALEFAKDRGVSVEVACIKLMEKVTEAGISKDVEYIKSASAIVRRTTPEQRARLIEHGCTKSDLIFIGRSKNRIDMVAKGKIDPKGIWARYEKERRAARAVVKASRMAPEGSEPKTKYKPLDLDVVYLQTRSWTAASIAEAALASGIKPKKLWATIEKAMVDELEAKGWKGKT